MPPRFRFLLGLLSCLPGVAACASSRHPQPAPNAAPAGATPAFLAGQPGRVRSHVLDFGIELTLPDKANWQIVEGPAWLVAEHRSSSSQLALRTWRADRVVRRAECEAQARLTRPTIPTVHEEAIVDRHTLPTPADFDTELVVGVEPDSNVISGYATVFGASVGRCYAAVFTTRVSGKDAELQVAARLGVVVDRILSQVRVRSVDERAPRRHLVVTPKPAPE